MKLPLGWSPMTPNGVSICCSHWPARAIEPVIRRLHGQPIDALRMLPGLLPIGSTLARAGLGLHSLGSRAAADERECTDLLTEANARLSSRGVARCGFTGSSDPVVAL